MVKWPKSRAVETLQDAAEMIAPERIAGPGDIDGLRDAEQRRERPLEEGIELGLFFLVGDDRRRAAGRAGEIAGAVMRQADADGRRRVSLCGECGERRAHLFRIAMRQAAIGDVAAIAPAAIGIGAVGDRGADFSGDRARPLPQQIGIERADRRRQPIRTADMRMAAIGGVEIAKRLQADMRGEIGVEIAVAAVVDLHLPLADADADMAIDEFARRDDQGAAAPRLGRRVGGIAHGAERPKAALGQGGK